MDNSHAPSTILQPGMMPPAPATGFVGRTREASELRGLLSTERATPVWITGYDGIGKTTLVAHVARQLFKDGRYEQIVYTSMGRSGVPEVALQDLGQRLLGSDWKPSADAVAQIEEALRNTRTLIIWDDVEPILYGGAIALEQPAMVMWYQTANRLGAQGGSSLCIVSDGVELPPSARRLVGVREYRLGPMDDGEAMELALSLSGVVDQRDDARADWEQLIRWIGGHPLALYCIAAARQGRPLQEVVSALAEQAPGLASGEGRFRNRAMDLALDYLTKHVEQPLAEHLPDLGVFVGGFIQNLGPEIMGIPRETWVEQSAPLAAAGLTWDESLPTMTIPMVLIHPSLLRWASQHLSTQRRVELTAAHYRHYFGFVTWVVKSATHLKKQGPQLLSRDIGNVHQGLNSILAAGEVSVAVNYIQLYNALLTELGYQEESDRTTEAVAKATRTILPIEGPWTRPGVELAIKQAETLISSGELQQAGALLSQLATRFEKTDGVDYTGSPATLDRVRVLVDLAHVLRSTEHADIAIRGLNEAVQLLDPFDSDDATRTRRAEIYNELLEVHLQLGQLDEAASACQRSLSALGTIENAPMRSTLHARAALLAMRRNDLDTARSEFENASGIMTASGDLAGLASVESQLAALALRPPSDIPEAMAHLDRAVGYAHRGEQWPVEAQLHSQIAQLAGQAGMLDQCEEHLGRVISLYEANDALGPLVLARAGLAEFHLRQGNAEKALVEAERALGEADSGGQAVPWELYLLQERIATALEDESASARWRAMTRGAYAQSPTANATLARWTPLIDALARSAHGQALDTEAAQALESMESSPQWSRLARVLWRVLSGERDPNAFADLDHIDSLVVNSLLQKIDQPRPPSEEASADEPEPQTNQG